MRRDGPHRFVRMPWPMTGPVGPLSVDAPGGSSETASAALLLASLESAGGSAITTVRSARNGPTARGLPSAPISQSSGIRVGSG